MKEKNSNTRVKWTLFVYDLVALLIIEVALLYVSGIFDNLTIQSCILNTILSLICIIGCRFVFKIYSQIWRYGGIQNYIKLILSDIVAYFIYFVITKTFPTFHISSIGMLAVFSVNLVCTLSMRMVYRYAYKYEDTTTPRGRFLLFLLKVFGGIKENHNEESRKINVAIYGAGNLGLALLNDIRQNKQSSFHVYCFVDADKTKVGRFIEGIKVISEEMASSHEFIQESKIQEVFFAIHDLNQEKKQKMYEAFSKLGLKSKNYDVPHVQDADEKAVLKEFDIEDLLFRKQIVVLDEKTCSYYKGKTILLTGGGGSIGSELCRQLAKMNPKTIIVLDIYENTAYDIQQEMKIKYGNDINIRVEICSITNLKALEKVFDTYHPNIVINAAAHKHVPLMEHNCIEAIENNIFGCKNLLDLTEKYNCERFMMVSTDKAVNPTNVMGATKRMCEMMVLSAAKYGKAVYSCTRFGNVLGSAGSVIPLFKRQIEMGGPVTITDKRIIRYFMTISEASQLVLQSGAMAKNGELFVLDMGKPVKILTLAENMIRLTGAKNIQITEIGLRPGEKLYEELLVKTEELNKTENELIFIERDLPETKESISEKLEYLKKVCFKSNSDEMARDALHEVVPTYIKPEVANISYHN